jgi:hypothetical protein
MESTTKEMFSVKDLHEDILEDLKCPECKLYLKKGPIQMCQQGHNFCNSCQKHVPSGTNCTAQPSNVRNFALEKIVATATYPCPFAELKGDLCKLYGNPFELEKHVRESHDSQELTGNEENELIKLSLTSERTVTKAIFTLNQLFFLAYETKEGMFYFEVYHVGRNKESSNYIYEFTIQKVDEHPKSCNMRNICHNYKEDHNEVKKSHDCVVLSQGYLEKYLHFNNVVPCDIKIRRKETSEDVEMKEDTTQPAISSDRAPDDM